MKGRKPITELTDLKGKQVVVQEGAITQEILRTSVPEAKEIAVSNIYDGFKLLSKGKYDVILCNEEMAVSIMKDLNITNLEMSEINRPPDEYCFVAHNDSLLSAIDMAYYNIQRSGEYDALFNKWFMNPIHNQIPQWVYVLFSVMGAAVAIGFLFVYVLRRQVDKARFQMQRLNQTVNDNMIQMRYVLNHSSIIVLNYDLSASKFTLDNGVGDNLVIDIDELLGHVPIETEKAEVLRIYKQMNERSLGEFSTQCEMTPVDSQKGNRIVIVNGFPMRDATGKIVSYSGLCRDVTELIQIQRDLERETERALQSEKLKSTFLANMSHEIRTPLNAIVGFSSLLGEVEDEEERKEYLNIITTNNELLLNLINDILDLSRIESGEMAIQNEMFDFAPYFESLSTSLEQRCTNPDVQFLIDAPYERCMICLDRNRLAQLCTNFTTNAIKYTHQGSIRLGYVYENDGIKIYVQDTGAGIPAEKHDMVFHRFEKLDSLVQGTGLGLSICKAVVDVYNGKIGLASKVGEGSTFWAWIPCKADIKTRM